MSRVTDISLKSGRHCRRNGIFLPALCCDKEQQACQAETYQPEAPISDQSRLLVRALIETNHVNSYSWFGIQIQQAAHEVHQAAVAHQQHPWIKGLPPVPNTDTVINIPTGFSQRIPDERQAAGPRWMAQNAQFWCTQPSILYFRPISKCPAQNIFILNSGN